jgi:hypothetical protein
VPPKSSSSLGLRKPVAALWADTTPNVPRPDAWETPWNDSDTPDTMPGAADTVSSFLANDGLDDDLSTIDANEPPTIEELKARRRPASAEDARVSEEAMRWLATLPRDRRLMYTMLDYPHVVNGLAKRWSDRWALSQYFENLLRSRRRQRAGFGPRAKAELEALRAWAFARGLLL